MQQQTTEQHAQALVAALCSKIEDKAYTLHVLQHTVNCDCGAEEAITADLLNAVAQQLHELR